MDGNLDFEFEANTEASGSCVASLKNEFYVLGGTNHKRQVIFSVHTPLRFGCIDVNI